MSYPYEMMNAANKQRKAEIDAATEKVQNQNTLLRLENEMNAVTQQKYRDAKNELGVAQKMYSSSSKKWESEESLKRQILVELDKQIAELRRNEGISKDLLLQVGQLEDRVGGTRSRLHLAQAEASSAENQMFEAIERNQATESATRENDAIVRELEAMTGKLRREAELKTNAIQQLESILGEDSAAYDQIQAEIREAQDAAERNRIERDSTKKQMEDLMKRDEELKKIDATHAASIRDLSSSISSKRAEADELIKELRVVEGEGKKAQQNSGNSQALRNRTVLNLQKAASTKDECDDQLRVLEYQLQGSESTKQKLAREKQQVLESLHEAKEKLSDIEEKEKSLKDYFSGNADVLEQAEKEEAMAELLLRKYAEDLRQMNGMIARGNMLIQNHIHEQMTFSTEAQSVDKNVQLFQRHLRDSDASQKELYTKLQVAEKMSTELDEQIFMVSEELDMKRGEMTEISSEVRKVKQAQIATLRADLEEVERTKRESQRAVDAVISNLKSQERTVAAYNSSVKEMEETILQTKLEIESLNRELDSIREKKQQAAENGEALWYKLEKMRSKADNMKEDVVAQLEENNAIEYELRQREAEMSAQKEGALLQLHAQEEDRRQMSIRLNSILHRNGLMKSRYEDHMSSLQRKVDEVGNEVEQEAAKAGKSTRGDELAIFVGSGEKLGEDASPEDLHARHMLRRAVLRDELQRKGDKLDGDIVKAEKDLRILETTLAKMKHSLSDARRQVQLLSEGGGSETELLMLDIAGGPSRQDEMFITEVRNRLLQASETDTRAQVHEIEVYIADLTEKFVGAQREYAETKARLNDAVQKKEEVVALVRSAERDLDAMRREEKSNALLSQKLSNVMLVKQRKQESIGAGISAGKRATGALLKRQLDELNEEKSKVDRAARALTRAVAVKATQEGSATASGGIYTKFRALCDKYGFEIDVTASVVDDENSSASGPPQRSATSSTVRGNRSSTMQSLGPNTANSRAPREEFPASKALIEAMIARQKVKQQQQANERSGRAMSRTRTTTTTTTTGMSVTGARTLSRK